MPTKAAAEAGAGKSNSVTEGEGRHVLGRRAEHLGSESYRN